MSVCPVVDNVNVLAESEHDNIMQYMQSSVAVNVSLVVATGLLYFGLVTTYVAVEYDVHQDKT